MIKQNPDAVVFLPTALLSEVQTKEFKSIEHMKDLERAFNDQCAIKNGYASRVSDDPEVIQTAIERLESAGVSALEDEAEYEQALADMMETVSKERREVNERKRKAEAERRLTADASDTDSMGLLYTVDSLGDVAMPLCPHGKVPFEAALNGVLKAVNREPAEELLRRYDMRVSWRDAGSSTRRPCELLSG